MNSKSLQAHIEILRPLNGLMMMAVVGVAVVLSQEGSHNWFAVTIAALVGGLVGSAANAINDYFDLGIYTINRPYRPLPRGAMSPRAAIILCAVLSLLGISLNVFLHWTALLIAVVAVIVLFWYSARLKRTVLLGNLAVALMTALAFIYGGSVAGHPERSIIPAVFAFLINMGREIVKDIEDMEGDLHGNAATFPIRFGVRKSLVLAAGVFAVLIGTTIGAFVWGNYNVMFLILVLIVDSMVAAGMVLIWRNQSPKNLTSMSGLLKVSMAVGLAAIYFGSQA